MEMEKSSKPFYNAASIYYRHPRANSQLRKEPNIKIFENGGLQMTGIDDIDTAKLVFCSLIEQMKQAHAEMSRDGTSILGDVAKCDLNNFAVHMLNSDFDAKFVIHRDNLCKILKDR